MGELKDKYALTGELGRLVDSAELDDDRVTMLTLGDESRADATVVVIKGHAEVELFRQWAERNKLFDRDNNWEGIPRHPQPPPTRRACPTCGRDSEEAPDGRLWRHSLPDQAVICAEPGPNI